MVCIKIEVCQIKFLQVRGNTCTCTYMYICVCTHIWRYIIYTSSSLRKYICIYVYAHTYVYEQIFAQNSMHTYTLNCTQPHIYKYAHIFATIPTPFHILAQAYTHLHRSTSTKKNMCTQHARHTHTCTCTLIRTDTDTNIPHIHALSFPHLCATHYHTNTHTPCTHVLYRMDSQPSTSKIS